MLSWQKLIAPIRPVTPPQVSADPIPSAPLPLQSLATAGVWNLKGWDGGLRTERVRFHELNATFDKILGSGQPSELVDPIEFDAWLQSARSILTVQLQPNSRRIYSRDEPDTRIRLATVLNGQTGQERFTGAAIALRVEPDRWLVIALQSLAADAVRQPFLIPFEGATLQVSRTDEAGQPVFQLLQTASFDDRHLEKWNTEGWTVARRIPSSTGAVTLICRKGDEGVAVWVSGYSSSPGLAMVTRLDPLHEDPAPEPHQ